MLEDYRVGASLLSEKMCVETYVREKMAKVWLNSLDDWCHTRPLGGDGPDGRVLLVSWGMG